MLLNNVWYRRPGRFFSGETKRAITRPAVLFSPAERGSRVTDRRALSISLALVRQHDPLIGAGLGGMGRMPPCFPHRAGLRCQAAVARTTLPSYCPSNP